MNCRILNVPREKGEPHITLKVWEPEGSIRGIVQILHGMAEHIARYEDTARALCSRGYLVAGHDHRGHGPQCPPDRLGWFAAKNGWRAILEDAHRVTLTLRRQWPHTRLILLGHSMGSFLAREYCLTWPKAADALVLSGTGDYPRPLTITGKALAALYPGEKKAAAVDKIAFSGNNKAFRPARTGFDWLSRDEKQVDKYIADPLCGFVFTGQAFRDFFGGLTALTDLKRLNAMNKDMPVLFISGDRDPVGGMGRGVRKTAGDFTAAGMKSVTVKLYPGARHELFNEINRDEVLEDLIGWLNAL